jgi:hypothetical protein
MSVSIIVREIKVKSLDIDFHEVSWELVLTSEDVLDYTFTVMRSEGAGGPFTPISAPIQDQYLFIDNVLVTGDRWRKYYYVIRVTHVPSGAQKDFGPASKDPEPDLIAIELRRHMQLLFQEFAGRRCWILPARTFGQRCSCWNPTLGARTRSGCVTCYDTGFVRGYMSPIESWIQIDPSPKTQQHLNVGKTQQVNTTMRLAFYPPVKPNDLVIEGENRRWKVVTVTQTEQGRAPVHQEVQLHEVPPKDIEFKVPLILDRALRDIWLSPKRNYTNPMNLQAFLDQEFPGIMSLYPARRPKVQ